MNDAFKVVKGDYSLQMTSFDSERLFIRVTDSSFGNKTIVFTEFLISHDDEDRAVSALLELREHLSFESGTTLKFLDIYPMYYRSSDNKEVARRHDKIVRVTGLFAGEIGVALSQAYLDKKFDKFDTIVELGPK